MSQNQKDFRKSLFRLLLEIVAAFAPVLAEKLKRKPTKWEKKQERRRNVANNNADAASVDLSKLLERAERRRSERR